MDYIFTISKKFPGVLVSCSGDPETYENLVWEGGEPLPPDADIVTAWHTVQREIAWLAIKAERDRRKAGGVKVGEKWYHSDDTSRIQQIGLVMMGANMPANLMWKTMDGTFILMTPTLASTIFSTIAYSDQNIFKVAEQHRAAMEASEVPESYDFSAGWPDTYIDIDGDQTT